MTDRFKPIVAALVPAVLAAGMAHALDATLDDAAVEAAVAEGRDQANTRGQGYQVQDYVLWDRAEPLHISPDTPLVDAVIVSTPTERLVYESYLQTFQGKDWPIEDARALADDLANSVGFRIFAHAESGGPEDRDFLDRFGEARLVLDGGPMLTSETEDVSGPATDFFITEDGHHVFRWLGTVTYRFDLAELSDPSGMTGTLRVDVPGGETREYDIDLSEYR